MGKLRKITGIWHGTYSYDPSDHMPQLDAVAFTLDLEQGWFGRFNGTVTDDGPRGMPGTGAIEGYFWYPRIEFTKQMPVCHIVTHDGRCITMRQFLIEQGYACERDVPHAPIFYRGEFSSPNSAEGTWIIRAGPLSLMDGRAVQMPECTGTWNIESRVA